MKYRKFIKSLIPGVCLCVLVQTSFAQLNKGSKGIEKSSDSPAAIVYDNGPFRTGSVARNGTSNAPAGTEWSEASWNFGETAASNTLAGVGCQAIGVATSNRCADDFSVPVGQTWTINQVIIYVYQTGFAGATSPVIGANVQIWNGRPGDAGATVIAGSTSNNLATSVDSSTFRIFNSGPPGNTATGTTRRIWETRINVVSPAVLTAGTYWVDFQVDAGAAGNFTPNTTISGIRGVPGWNARQFIGPPTNTGWADSVDAGNPATALDVLNDFPFKLEGSIAGAPAIPRSRSLDFNGDNKSDFAVARASGATAQTTWLILNSAGGQSGIDWGLGVGFGAGDKATPADYDGDGITDVAVWRPGAATSAAFYVLNSLGNTVSIIPFGQTGDDSSIVGDYDGDGKADAAVYRPGNNTFYYRGTMSNPGGNVTFVPFGIGGDIAIPGDFDGDGRFDFNIARNSGGQITHWQLRSAGGVVTFPYGLNTDKYVTGDFDGDGRFDVAAVRTNGSVFDWYILKSSTLQTLTFTYGNPATDYLIPSDYDGDSKTDFAVWRSEVGSGNGYFFTINTSSSPQSVKWGGSAGPLTTPDFPVGNFKVK